MSSPRTGLHASHAKPVHAIADDIDHPLDPRSVTASRITGVIVLAIVGFINLVPALIVPFFTDMRIVGRLALIGLWLTLAVVFTVYVLIWPGIRYRYASYRVNERGIQIRSGVVFRSVVSVPRSRVQHTDVSRGPIERNFGLASLIIHTAGTQHASVTLGGLAEEPANAIRDFLIEGGEDDAV